MMKRYFKGVQPHVNIAKIEAEIAFLPGPPERALEIAKIFSSYEKVREQREFVTYKGETEGNKLMLSENKTEIRKTITIRLPDYLLRELPEEESSIYEILNLGLKQLKIEKAIEGYKMVTYR